VTSTISSSRIRYWRSSGVRSCEISPLSHASSPSTPNSHGQLRCIDELAQILRARQPALAAGAWPPPKRGQKGLGASCALVASEQAAEHRAFAELARSTGRQPQCTGIETIVIAQPT